MSMESVFYATQPPMLIASPPKMTKWREASKALADGVFKEGNDTLT